MTVAKTEKILLRFFCLLFVIPAALFFSYVIFEDAKMRAELRGAIDERKRIEAKCDLKDKPNPNCEEFRTKDGIKFQACSNGERVDKVIWGVK